MTGALPSLVGASPPRPDGLPKATGAARFADDVQVAGLWHGSTVRSPYPHARIRELRWHPNRTPADAVCVTALDYPAGGWRVLALVSIAGLVAAFVILIRRGAAAA